LISVTDLNIRGNPFLTSLTGLEQLNSTRAILIRENNVLTSLVGLDNIDAITISALNISQNDSLSTCEMQCICDFLAAPNWNIFISDNAPGCNSPEEVEEACVGVSVEDIDPAGVFSIYPIPTDGISDIRYRIQASPRQSVACSNVRLSICNIRGEEISVLVNEKQPPGEYFERFDGSDLPAGFYLVRLRTGENIETVKMIIMR